MLKKILVVDDAMFMRKMIRRILEGEGFLDIMEAENGDAALSLFEEETPDLVILDITMPGISGIQVLEEMKKRRQETPVVMCSAVGQESMICQALEKGAADFIIKPFKQEEFVRTVRYYLQ